MKFEAWPVEPPGFGNVPFSIWTMSRHPRRARWKTRLLPTMPPPMTTTRARSGSWLILSPRSLDTPRRSAAPRVASSVQVDDHRLQLCQAIDREPAPDAPEAAALAAPATEGQVRLPVVRAFVDVDPPGPNGFGELDAAPQVGREDRGEEPVRRAVDDPDRLVHVADRRDRDDGSERLLRGDHHVARHRIEDRRLPEERAPERWVAVAAGE